MPVPIYRARVAPAWLLVWSHKLAVRDGTGRDTSLGKCIQAIGSSPNGLLVYCTRRTTSIGKRRLRERT